MGNWLIIIVLCTLHCATHLVAEEELLDSVDSVTTEGKAMLSATSISRVDLIHRLMQFSPTYDKQQLWEQHSGFN